MRPFKKIGKEMSNFFSPCLLLADNLFSWIISPHQADNPSRKNAGKCAPRGSPVFFYHFPALIHYPLTLIQPGSGKSVNYRGLFGFDLAFTICKLTSPSFWHVCIERCGFGNLPRTVWQHLYTENQRETGPTENQPPPALYAARDQKLIRILLAPHCTADHGPAGLILCLGGL